MDIKKIFKSKKTKVNVKETAKKIKIQKIKMSKHQFETWQTKTDSFKLKNIISDSFALSKEYIDLMQRYIPNISDAIWTWKHLCNTKIEIQFNGGTSKQRNNAEIYLTELKKRINPLPAVKNGGFNNLLDIYFEHYFKYGRTTGILTYDKNMTQVESYKMFNPYNVRFLEDLTPILFINTEPTYINQNNFYYNAQNADTLNPYGFSMIESSPSLVKINDDLLRDMANSSSNAGVPRLHIKIDQPEKADRESNEDYIERANNYFDDTVSNLTNIGSDENFYTWKDMEIGIAGGSAGATGFVWRINRQLIDEEMITAFHLFPWAMAKSTGTTKNWVQSQFDLLMTEVDSIQKEAINFIEWIIERDLSLKGLTEIKATVQLKRFRDPAIKNIAVAERFQIENVLTKVRNGIIDPDEGARELGRKTWFDKKLIEKENNNIKKPKTKIDESEQPVDKGKNPEKSPDEKK